MLRINSNTLARNTGTCIIHDDKIHEISIQHGYTNLNIYICRGNFFFFLTNCYWPVAAAAVAVTGPKNCHNRVPRTRLGIPRCHIGSTVPDCPRIGTSTTARRPRTPTSGRKWTAWSPSCWTDIYTHTKHASVKNTEIPYRRVAEFVNMAKHISTYKVERSLRLNGLRWPFNATQWCMSVPWWVSWRKIWS